ncbi:MAG TPA: UDP-N-acetylglucosamine--N-acetylmuramyl-(pentapeptide) pyrophosphoryl-undecaprenol N-acetylglucosamine transferase [Opitutaceae bacterium]
MSRFLISCGGTGGHLSPGIALAEGLRARGHQAVLLISHKKVDTRLIEKYPHLTFERIPGAPFKLRPVGFARFIFKQTAGLFRSVRLVRNPRPDAIVGFGGFTTAAIILAGALFRVPVALHEANRVPGRAIRLLGRLARRVYVPSGVRMKQVRFSALYPMGLPVRPDIVRLPREVARRSLGLDPQQPVLVVLGGSQGASKLNEWARQRAEALAFEGIQLYCVTGLGKGETGERTLKSRNGQPVKAIFVPFSDRIGELLSAADLVVSRAGAGTIAELIRCETPAILIPYPHAADNHQEANARYFEQQGGGLVVGQEHMTDLLREVRDVIFNDWLLRKFRSNLTRMDRANSLQEMLNDLEAMIQPADEPAPKPTQHAPA